MGQDSDTPCCLCVNAAFDPLEVSLGKLTGILFIP